MGITPPHLSQENLIFRPFLPPFLPSFLPPFPSFLPLFLLGVDWWLSIYYFLLFKFLMVLSSSCKFFSWIFVVFVAFCGYWWFFQVLGGLLLLLVALGGYWCFMVVLISFLAVLSYSWWFFVGFGCVGSLLWFLLVLGDYLWFFVVFCGSWWSLGVFGDDDGYIDDIFWMALWQF